jgi:DNA polymerase III alpha subunit
MGIQPIAGIQLSGRVRGSDPSVRLPPPPPSIVLLAQNDEGYRNLAILASRAYFDVELGRRRG